MLTTVLAGTDIRVSRLSFGTASLHHLLGRNSRQRLLDAAVHNGFTHFDTAPSYGHGLAEAELGSFLARRGQALTVATKFGLYPRFYSPKSIWQLWSKRLAGRAFGRPRRPATDWSLESADASLEQSLKRLRRDHVDILFLHEPVFAAMDSERILGWLERQRQLGRVAAWGLAGTAAQALPWIEARHPLAQVLQIRDGIVGAEADALRRHSREPQLTYGYLSECRRPNMRMEPEAVLGKALARNRSGSILVSTRRVERVPGLAAVADRHHGNAFA